MRGEMPFSSPRLLLLLVPANASAQAPKPTIKTPGSAGQRRRMGAPIFKDSGHRRPPRRWSEIPTAAQKNSGPMRKWPKGSGRARGRMRRQPPDNAGGVGRRVPAADNAGADSGVMARSIRIMTLRNSA
jgi:hypothetical protein